MRAIYFIESKGTKYYKTDTFWSKSIEHKYAKVHDDSQYDIERFFTSLLGYWNRNKEKLTSDELSGIVDFYDNSIYGYQLINDSREPIETHSIKLIRYHEGDLISDDYKSINRDNKIDDILNTKI
jgi:hypothetical protein